MMEDDRYKRNMMTPPSGSHFAIKYGASKSNYTSSPIQSRLYAHALDEGNY